MSESSFSQENLAMFFAWTNIEHLKYDVENLSEYKRKLVENTPVGAQWTVETYLNDMISQYIRTRISK